MIIKGKDQFDLVTILNMSKWSSDKMNYTRSFKYSAQLLKVTLLSLGQSNFDQIIEKTSIQLCFKSFFSRELITEIYSSTNLKCYKQVNSTKSFFP